MEEKDNTIIDIPKEQDEATINREKRKRMCNEILKKERENLSKTVKESDAEMARKLKLIIERFA